MEEERYSSKNGEGERREGGIDEERGEGAEFGREEEEAGGVGGGGGGGGRETPLASSNASVDAD